ncbi:MAG: hypothetical protein ACT4PZ_08365 [Panacagrimonas sp.]
MSDKILKICLAGGVAYFCCMSAAHFLGFKVPLLFIYWNVPSNHYQDMIISFCAFTYAVLFFAAFRHRAVVPAALLALGGTVLGLSAVNASPALASMLDGAPTTVYWIQTAMLAGFLALLIVLHLQSKPAA